MLFRKRFWDSHSSGVWAAIRIRYFIIRFISISEFILSFPNFIGKTWEPVITCTQVLQRHWHWVKPLSNTLDLHIFYTQCFLHQLSLYGEGSLCKMVSLGRWSNWAAGARIKNKPTKTQIPGLQHRHPASAELRRDDVSVIKTSWVRQRFPTD